MMPPVAAPTQQPTEDVSDSLVRATTYALVFFAPLAIGTVDTWSHLTASLGMLAAFSVLAFRRRSTTFTVTPLGIMLVCITGFTAAQCLPMPTWVIAALSPRAFELRSGAALALAAHVGWMPLSVDAYATLGEMGKNVGYVLLFVVATTYFAANDRRVQALLSVIVAAGVTVAVIGFIQTLILRNRIYGLFAIQVGFFGSTFVNPNHLAGFLGLCSPLAAGLAVTARRRAKRLSFFFIAVFLGSTVFLTLSRGGIVAFIAGQAMLGTLLILGRGASDSHRRRTWAIPIVIAAVLGSSAWVGYAKIRAEFGSEHVIDGLSHDPKARLRAEDRAMLADFFVTGIGRGAYAQLQTLYKKDTTTSTYTHIENEYVQAVADWGILGAALVLAIIITWVLAAWRAPRTGHWVGVLAALFAIGLHNTVDFNLQTGGVAVPFVLLMGLCARQGFGASMPTLGKRGARWTAGVAGTVIVVAFCAQAHYSRQADLERWRYAENTRDEKQIKAAHEAVLRHPTDYLFALKMANYVLSRGRQCDCDNCVCKSDLDAALAWVGRALHLNPTAAEAHLLAARILVARGDDDMAAAAYILAAASSPARRGLVIDEVAQKVRKGWHPSWVLEQLKQSQLPIGGVEDAQRQ